MKLLLDESVPKRLAASFPASFTLCTVQEMGWSGTGNGLFVVELRQRIRATLRWAEAHGFIDSNPAGDAIDGALPSMPAVRRDLRALA